MNSFINTCYRLCKWAMRFVYLNLLWIVFSIVGLGVLGLMPATIAMYAVVRKWIMEDNSIPIWKVFWHSYRTNFLKNSLFGFVILLIGYVLLIEMNIFWTQDSALYFAISLAVLTTFIIYIIILIYLLPIFVHFESTIPQYIKRSLVMGIIHPFLTVCLLLWIIFLYLTFWAVPLLFIFVGGSIPAFVIMRSAFKRFPKFEQTQG